MARIILNPAIQIISGDVGGFVYRQQDDGSVIVARPPLPDPDRVPTEAQAQQLQRFKEASARFQRLMEDTDLKNAYQAIIAERGIPARLRALVIGDILKAPRVSTVDLSHYTGAVGDTIRVVAEDSVGVARLTLTIHDSTSGQDLETAEKVVSEKISGVVEWVYTATVAAPADHLVEVRVVASDLAQNESVSVTPIGQ